MIIRKTGIQASPGVAIGPALVLDTEEYRIPRRTVTPAERGAQIRALDAALTASRQEIQELMSAAALKLGQQSALIFAFHDSVLGDPRLRAEVVEGVERNGYTAAYAFAQAMNSRQRYFLSVTNTFIREKVEDLYDIEKRVLRHMLGRAREEITRLTEPVIIVAHQLTPSQVVSLDKRQIVGLAIDVGGQTSHSVIFARMLGIPAVVALNDFTADVAGGDRVIVDGTHGLVIANPDDDIVADYRKREQQYHQFESSLRALRDLAAETRDGTRIHLLANIELAQETRAAIEAGADGVGLYRTEFLYISSDTLPSEEIQYDAIRQAVRHAGGKPVTVRTADFGADKNIPCLAQEPEDNPFLGLRSLRYCLAHLDMFKTQLRAILRASAEGDVRIMFPMVTTLMELRQAKTVLNDVMEDLDENGIAFRADVPVGIMVETPAAALLAQTFVREVDFVSIGTNDLTQYTLAVDRGNERVAYLYSAHNPAVLQLIRGVMRAAERAEVDVNLCGEMAGDPLYCQLLLGLGLRQLSMTPKNIPEIKKIVRSTTLRKCRTIAARTLKFDAERQVINFLRDEVRKIIPEAV